GTASTASTAGCADRAPPSSRHLRAGGDLAGVCWDRHGELVDRIEARDRAGAHRIVNDYNLATVELLARRLGQPLDGVAVLRLLREPLIPPPPAPAERPPAAAPRPASAAVGLGRVPMPRFVPPGRFARPFRPGSGEPAAGR
ncbi:hypothetical protein ABZ391_36330, partial [Kitasatospora cineracea]